MVVVQMSMHISDSQSTHAFIDKLLEKQDKDFEHIFWENWSIFREGLHKLDNVDNNNDYINYWIIDEGNNMHYSTDKQPWKLTYKIPDISHQNQVSTDENKQWWLEDNMLDDSEGCCPCWLCLNIDAVESVKIIYLPVEFKNWNGSIIPSLSIPLVNVRAEPLLKEITHNAKLMYDGVFSALFWTKTWASGGTFQDKYEAARTCGMTNYWIMDSLESKHYHVRVEDGLLGGVQITSPHTGVAYGYFGDDGNYVPNIFAVGVSHCDFCEGVRSGITLKVVWLSRDANNAVIGQNPPKDKFTKEELKHAWSLLTHESLTFDVRDVQRVTRPILGVKPYNLSQSDALQITKIRHGDAAFGMASATKFKCQIVHEHDAIVHKIIDGEVDNRLSLLIGDSIKSKLPKLIWPKGDLSADLGVYVINVYTMAVEVVTESTQYVAISHSWAKWQEGSKQDYLAGGHAIPNLKKEAGFDSVYLILQEVRKRGYNYAWLDWLCVDQSDSANQSIDLSTQLSVFANADIVLYLLRGSESKMLIADPDSLSDDLVVGIMSANRWCCSDWTVQEYWANEQREFMASSGEHVNMIKWLERLGEILDKTQIKDIDAGLLTKVKIDVCAAEFLAIAKNLRDRETAMTGLLAYHFLVPNLNVHEIIAISDEDTLYKRVVSATNDFSWLATQQDSMPDVECAWVLDNMQVGKSKHFIQVPSRGVFSGGILTVADPVRCLVVKGTAALPVGHYLLLGCEKTENGLRAVMLQIILTSRAARVWHAIRRLNVSLEGLNGQLLMWNRGAVMRVGVKLDE